MIQNAILFLWTNWTSCNLSRKYVEVYFVSYFISIPKFEAEATAQRQEIAEQQLKINTYNFYLSIIQGARHDSKPQRVW